ncbi:MAG TPA: matrixin family metalloprotease [Longimicrobium sp.]
MADPDPRRRLELLPAGGVSLQLLSELGRALDHALGTRHRIASPFKVLSAWRSGDAVRCDAVLDALLARVDAEGRVGPEIVMMVVTSAPLVALDGSRVFGQAAVGGGCAVIGLGALDGGSRCDETTLAERARKVAMHEAAHAAGLEHCADPTCVMYPARDIADVDRKAIGFCARCSGDLAHATLDAARG